MLAGRIWDTTEPWWESICMQLANILKYEDKSLRLASWQHRLRWKRANKLTTCSTSTVGPFMGQVGTCHLTDKRNKRKKRRAVRATIKGNWSGSSLQIHPVRVLDYFFNGGIGFFQRHLQGTHWEFGWLWSMPNFHVNKCDIEAFLVLFQHVLCADVNLFECTPAVVSCLITSALRLMMYIAAF